MLLAVCVASQQAMQIAHQCAPALPVTPFAVSTKVQGPGHSAPQRGQLECRRHIPVQRGGRFCGAALHIIGIHSLLPQTFCSPARSSCTSLA